MDPEELKTYCLDYLQAAPAKRRLLLEIFCLILRSQGKSYQCCRTAWIRHNGKQLDLFDELRVKARRLTAAPRK